MGKPPLVDKMLLMRVKAWWIFLSATGDKKEVDMGSSVSMCILCILLLQVYHAHAKTVFFLQLLHSQAEVVGHIVITISIHMNAQEYNQL